ncbi:SDR family NAD(P)-dependent oxidoreductase [Roseomonas chloroacetimidivorans]|uniref:SDR family NAD(P)-dependent oxidoreductase n=1 Tax=Roseomonas chloroacetimidivorans TaxID=1766656 RepID=UPI003C78B648
MEISGSVAVVTGAASGIGAATARALAEAGARVAMADIDRNALEQEAATLAATGVEVLPVTLDVADRTSWQGAARAIRSRFGSASILVNNAGVSSRRASIGSFAPEFWDRLIEINLTGVFNGAHLFLTELLPPGAPGHVVNTASVCGLFSTPELGAYTASKFGVVGLSEVMRFELAARGVGVSVLCPGFVATGIVARSVRDSAGDPASDAERQALAERLRSAMSASDVAARVVDGIRRNLPYILTHGEYAPVAARRAAAIAEAFRDVQGGPAFDDPSALGGAWLSTEEPPHA